MHSEIADLRKLRWTFCTEVWFLTSVSSSVFREIASADEFLIAFVASEWLFAAMKAFVSGEIAALRKLRWTFRTEVLFDRDCSRWRI